ncbi:uncharacterized protein LOC127410291 [Myxocyprinus asiaticus]|uniref:uncharacterized protein LOC127410291 n=1 Tax=Myxocyprinus asiaticus TaxID=70543 RepID=UPI00222311AD|nr:uncharacterized protein LOC127410291 [Myxocyprinus asiaticus]XP_051501440.1 uncharacterized protein LOC127410291 [Myxocyprinus asiaticus]XP_051501441.1 uncharacterized protein LOC127410291 [Myxocyprinus asiaticus]
MAPVEEGVITWLSGCSSSLHITIVSALFIITYITLYSLCARCFSASESPMHFHRREKRNSPTAFPQNEVPTEQFNRNVNKFEHGHSHFNQELIPIPSQIPGDSMGTSTPLCVKIPPLPSLPSDPMAHLEPLRRSFHQQDSGNVTSQSYDNSLCSIPAAKYLTDHIHSLMEFELNEENPYECIREPLSDKADGESESPSPAMAKLLEPAVNHSVTALNNLVNNQAVGQPLISQTHSDQYLTSTEPTVVYAAVNWKTKSQKNTEALFHTDAVVDMADIAEEAVPPIPDKHF